MAHSEAVVAAGVGCRAGCPAEDVLAALERALGAQGRRIEEVGALYTAQFKQTEPGLLRAAELLNKPIVALPLEQLQAQAAGALTRSVQTLERFGVPSVAETAALAGASTARGGAPEHGARLLGPRLVLGSAACALAIGGAGGEP